jgi:hypothetical protein
MADIREVVGDLHLATVVVNVQDMQRAVKFWSAALAYAQNEQPWNPEFMKLVDAGGKRPSVPFSWPDLRRRSQSGCI